MKIRLPFRNLRHWFKRVVKGHGLVPDRNLINTPEQIENFREWKACDESWYGSPRILMASGHGYGNVGDEAQCGACIDRWKRVAPTAKITLFSPSPGYTESVHGQQCQWAPRVAWFRCNTGGPYFAESKPFERFYFWLKLRLIISAHLLKLGIPLLVCNPREASILNHLYDHDLLHISGGGFLTGKTRSRLWENCLLMKICRILEIPYILTGHNIGVFQNNRDKRVAKMGLRGASYIGLRDRMISQREIAEIGIEGPHVESTCDDALFCDALEIEQIKKRIGDVGGDPEQTWVAVNFHHWGQDESQRDRIEQRFAELCDHIVAELGYQTIFIAMTPSDVEPEQRVIGKMQQPAYQLQYSPDYKVARGLIAASQFVFTMKHHPIVFAQGEGVPVVAVALDSYYHHKNLGALANTETPELLLDEKSFYEQTAQLKLRQTIENREQIVAKLKRWTDEMKMLELVPYQNTLAILAKQREGSR